MSKSINMKVRFFKSMQNEDGADRRSRFRVDDSAKPIIRLDVREFRRKFNAWLERRGLQHERFQ